MNSILNMIDIDKKFGVVHALKDVNLEIFPNEIVGVVGENGAGKSTLMKILLGIYHFDGGQIFISGKKVQITNPRDANKHGVYMVFQEQSLLINMTVYENLFLGFENHFTKNGMISKRLMIEAARVELSKIGLDIDPNTQVNQLSFIQRQMIEILRNLWQANISGADNVIVVLDEPTSALGEKDSETLFHLMVELKKRASLIFISHKLNEIVKMCDRIYVLKDGKNEHVFTKVEVSEELLRTSMIGGTIEGEYYLVDKQRKSGDQIILEVQNLNKENTFTNISFQVREGEIFCITGTLGSGKEALCDALFGLAEFDSGKIFFKGKEIKPKSPLDAVSAGIGLSPDDRKGKGLVLGMSVTDNMTLPTMRSIISIRHLSQLAVSVIKRLRIVTPSEKTLIRNLSGGNQQKVIIGRLLISNYPLIILAYPTRGVDVGAKREIYELIREMANKGNAIILMGDSFEEDIGLANTILALKDGKCTGLLNAEEQKPSLEELANYIL